MSQLKTVLQSKCFEYLTKIGECFKLNSTVLLVFFSTVAVYILSPFVHSSNELILLLLLIVYKEWPHHIGRAIQKCFMDVFKP